MEKVRIQKLIAESGYCSRRKAEELINAGVVQVNGRTVSIGDKASVKDIITVDGERLPSVVRRAKRYIMLHKPRGYVTTASDELGRKCVMDLLTDIDERLYPIGRLDRNSEGLLLFTNDGAFANMIMHPSRHIGKTYRVTVNSTVTEEQLTDLSAGVVLDDGEKTQTARVEVEVNTRERSVLRMTIFEGKNRQIRRMCEAVGLEVVRLRRTSIGPVKLGMLKPGAWRDLKPEEIRALREAGGKK